MLKALLTLLGWSDPPNPHLWHKCGQPLLPVILEDGRLQIPGRQLWRRKVNGRWVYQQDEETEEEWDNRQI